MISKRYTPIYYRIINQAWKTAKPYLERLDVGERFNDDILERMSADAERFARENFKDLVKGDPDLNREICESCYHLLQAIAISAEREGCLKLEKNEDEQIKGQQGMFEGSY